MLNISLFCLFCTQGAEHPKLAVIAANAAVSHHLLPFLVKEPYKKIAKDCLLTLVKGRLALGSPGWLVVRLFVCHHAENGPIHRKMVVDCPLVIISKVKLFFRPDKTRKKE